MRHSFEQKNCLRIRVLLDSYLNNELLVETTHDLLRHLESCSDCARELEQRECLKAIIKKAVIREAVPASLQASIKNSIRRKPYDNWARWTLVAATTVRDYLKRLGAGM
jgi:predicted anti-sigma-YlaC factor YlaD